MAKKGTGTTVQIPLTQVEDTLVYGQGMLPQLYYTGILQDYPLSGAPKQPIVTIHIRNEILENIQEVFNTQTQIVQDYMTKTLELQSSPLYKQQLKIFEDHKPTQDSVSDQMAKLINKMHKDNASMSSKEFMDIIKQQIKTESTEIISRETLIPLPDQQPASLNDVYNNMVIQLHKNDYLRINKSEYQKLSFFLTSPIMENIHAQYSDLYHKLSSDTIIKIENIQPEPNTPMMQEELKWIKDYHIAQILTLPITHHNEWPARASAAILNIAATGEYNAITPEKITEDILLMQEKTEEARLNLQFEEAAVDIKKHIVIINELSNNIAPQRQLSDIFKEKYQKTKKDLQDKRAIKKTQEKQFTQSLKMDTYKYKATKNKITKETFASIALTIFLCAIIGTMIGIIPVSIMAAPISLSLAIIIPTIIATTIVSYIAKHQANKLKAINNNIKKLKADIPKSGNGISSEMKSIQVPSPSKINRTKLVNSYKDNSKQIERLHKKQKDLELTSYYKSTSPNLTAMFPHLKKQCAQWHKLQSNLIENMKIGEVPDKQIVVSLLQNAHQLHLIANEALQLKSKITSSTNHDPKMVGIEEINREIKNLILDLSKISSLKLTSKEGKQKINQYMVALEEISGELIESEDEQKIADGLMISHNSLDNLYIIFEILHGHLCSLDTYPTGKVDQQQIYAGVNQFREHLEGITTTEPEEIPAAEIVQEVTVLPGRRASFDLPLASIHHSGGLPSACQLLEQQQNATPKHKAKTFPDENQSSNIQSTKMHTPASNIQSTEMHALSL